MTNEQVKNVLAFQVSVFMSLTEAFKGILNGVEIKFTPGHLIGTESMFQTPPVNKDLNRLELDLPTQEQIVVTVTNLMAKHNDLSKVFEEMTVADCIMSAGINMPSVYLMSWENAKAGSVDPKFFDEVITMFVVLAQKMQEVFPTIQFYTEYTDRKSLNACFANVVNFCNWVMAIYKRGSNPVAAAGPRIQSGLPQFSKMPTIKFSAEQQMLLAAKNQQQSGKPAMTRVGVNTVMLPKASSKQVPAVSGLPVNTISTSSTSSAISGGSKGVVIKPSN